MKTNNAIVSGAPKWVPNPNGVLGLLVLCSMLLTGVAWAETRVERTIGVGWDNGLTLRYWVAGQWELAIGAGPDDHLIKEESRAWRLDTPPGLNGQLEIPTDQREEHGWVRFQIGRLMASRDNLDLVLFSGLTHEWSSEQTKSEIFDPVVADYDMRDVDRYTKIWSLELGLRPSWRPVDFLTIEMAFGLRFNWESWEQTQLESQAGTDGHDRTITDGHGRSFDDFGWDGVTSLQFIFWL